MANRQIKNKPALPAKPTAAANTSPVLPTWLPVAIIVFTAILYSGALQNGITYMDDDEYILNNTYLRDFSWNGIRAIFSNFHNFNYHPLTTLSFWVDYSLWGLNPLPYHLENVLLHLVNVWLVYLLAMKLSGKQLTGLIVSLLFAIHPLHVESVAWISERKDVLYALFYLLALLSYVRYLDRPNAKQLTFTLVFYLASLLSKPTAVTLPLLLVAIDIYKGRKLTTKVWLEKLPFLLLSVHFGILTILAQDKAINNLAVAYSFINRVFLFFAGLAFYFVKLIFPFGLSAIHFFPTVNNGLLPWYYYLSLPFLIILAWLVARRSPNRKQVLFGVAFFAITISVMLQVVTVGAALAAERYTYIPYIGLFFIAAQWYATTTNDKLKRIAKNVFAIYVLLFTAIAWQRIKIWKDTDTLFADVVEKNPGNWRNSYIYYFWGKSKHAEGDLRAAFDKYTEAINTNKSYPKPYAKRAQVFEELGNLPGALSDYNTAIRLDAHAAPVYNGRGWVHFRRGGTNAALADYNKAISLNPKLSEAYNNRGWLYFTSGDTVAALLDYDRAIAAVPSFAKPYYNRAVVKVNRKNFAGAIDDYTSIIKYNPSESQAYYNRGLIYLEMKNREAAYNDLVKASEMGNNMAAQILREEFK
jgi:tetratricopeptide (TPR) repeat protein